tara:strand:+ start:1972 stop:2589 length:618 start_codon:yes stop_codon:yes gene_type:complete
LKKNKISKNWIIKQKKDIFFKKAKTKGYRSRSAFKLIEIDKKFKVFNQKFTLLDLGSSPGGWSQVAREKLKKGKILAVDLKPMEKIENVEFIQGDFNDKKVYEKILLYFNDNVDIIISDMAANTSGNKDLDSYRTGELCLNAMNFATKILKKDGIFLSKVFMGAIFKEIDQKAKKMFKSVIKFKPLSSKKESKEIYIICKGILNL